MARKIREFTTHRDPRGLVQPKAFNSISERETRFEVQ